ncbi:hypothetical protein DSCO28_30410 [Desulfosarcina ovata subsp. sediminis]|uniref:Terminase large subunit gp17-like C-terminal domain-containing protein n=1 Tax=Desulfosarcina ovata subsp. sediminis TaxID=885957 RepID=A0A5K7ZP33_9BACT|nr:hypothetical protein [Desulfosarcina ovata]BBO82475.1 hypothetical protein DSCO28_30410 [Desulfosarcina ovata subsp. sediminis]
MMLELESYRNSIHSGLLDQLCDSLENEFGGDADTDFKKYQNDPVGFCRDILGDEFPPQIEELLGALVDVEVVTGQSSNAFGKSYAGARAALWFFLCFPNSQIYISAAPPETNIRRILWAQILAVLAKHPELTKGLTIKDLHIERSATHFLTSVTVPVSADEAILESKSSGKHAENMLWMVDEADGVPDAFFRGIQGCTSGGLSRQLYFFNPKRKAGFIYRSIRDRRTKVIKLNAFDHPSVVTGKDLYPGSVTRASVVRRINEMCRPLVADEKTGPDTFELPDYLVGAVAKSQAGEPYQPLAAGHYKIIENQFAYSVLGQYPPTDETQLISQAWIDLARSRYDSYVTANGETPPMGTMSIAGLDLAEFGGDANALCLRYGNFVPPMKTWGGMDIIASSDRAFNECQGRNASVVNCDGTGVGAAAAPYLMQKGMTAKAVKVGSSAGAKLSDLGEFGRLRDELWWRVRDWLAGDQAMLPPDEQLLEELTVATYTIDDSGRIKILKKDEMRKQLQRSPDRADALCLTFAPSGFFGDCDLS